MGIVKLKIQIMKKIILLFLVAFSVNAFSQSVSIRPVIPAEYLADIQIECDGVSDLLTSMDDVDYTYHIVEHYDKKMDNVLGVRWSKNQGHNKVISTVTGEIFEIHEINSGDLTKGIWIGKLKLKGDQGSKIHIKMKLEWTDPLSWPTLIEIETKCF